MTHHVEFKPSGRGAARCPADPKWPQGMALDVSTPGAPSCFVKLPYPAPECGMWVLQCGVCSLTVAVTAAGRPDDPVSVRLPCNLQKVQRSQ